MRIRYILSVLITVLALNSLNAKTVIWSIPAQYADLKYYSGNLLLCQSNNKWGIVTTDNNTILSPQFDFITQFMNGYALAGVQEGGRYLLKAIIDKNGNVKNIAGTYYLSNHHQYFAEDKMAVTNKSGKYGFINAFGEEVIKCQFDNAFPFCEGKALIKKGNYVQYIKEAYDSGPNRNTLVVDFHYGEMTDASCFSDGKAVVAYNSDYALINSNGQRIKKIKESEYKQLKKTHNAPPANNEESVKFDNTINIVSGNNKYGYQTGNSLIVSPYFDFADNVTLDGSAIVSVNNRKGLIRFIDHDYSASIYSTGQNPSTTTLSVDRKGVISTCRLDLSVPNVVFAPNIKIYADCGDGNIQELAASTSADNILSATLTPKAQTDAESCTVSIRAVYDGLPVFSTDKTFDLSYPIRLRISEPRTVTERADENDKQDVYAYVYNDSNKSVTVKATFTVKKTDTFSMTIPAHGSRKISLTEENVQNEETVKAVITLSSGEHIFNNVVLKPFF